MTDEPTDCFTVDEGVRLRELAAAVRIRTSVERCIDRKIDRYPPNVQVKTAANRTYAAIPVRWTMQRDDFGVRRTDVSPVRMALCVKGDDGNGFRWLALIDPRCPITDGLHEWTPAPEYGVQGQGRDGWRDFHHVGHCSIQDLINFSEDAGQLDQLFRDIEVVRADRMNDAASRLDNLGTLSLD